MPIITINKVMEEIGIKTRNHGLDEREMELVKLLMADCKSTGYIQPYTPAQKECKAIYHI
ncbi:MAG: hypothetical protein K2H90_02955 [Oscillospiraceae bacterium]|nr:hypothetical protein [Oscillospiraceae bacterium]